LDGADPILFDTKYSVDNSSFITKEDIRQDKVLDIFFENGRNIKGIPELINIDVSIPNRKYYVESILVKEHCTVLEKIELSSLNLIVIASSLYILTLIFFVKIICRYRKKVEVRESREEQISNKLNTGNFNQQLELVPNDT